MPNIRAMGRRACMALLLSSAATLRVKAAPSIRLGVLQFGSVQWIASLIRNRGLDAARGFALQSVLLANTDAGRVALMAGAADVVVSDWLFAAAQRANGTPLCFAPFSSAAGALMAPAKSAIKSLTELPGKKLGVAGGPTDKSWIILQAAARAQYGLDLARGAQVVYAAPPLLSAKLQQGELDSVLTYWNFAARLEADGCRQLISMADCYRVLGLPERTCLVGYVFHQRWAEQNRAAVNGFLAASAAAEDLLAHDPAAWNAIRPLMDAPDEAIFSALKNRFINGIVSLSTEQQAEAAKQVFRVLQRTGGGRAVGGLDTLPEGLFWRAESPAI
ncbi:MAG: ABC transporter substrate-binding protein [Acetobacteraceae bacterium]|nr:ABC transporter substrate-binding protein [Acetobacteraceae bacterium]MBV8591216.1 ABC transporter substrate-binding protein [Acetobacteraceae bacterium]